MSLFSRLRKGIEGFIKGFTRDETVVEETVVEEPAHVETEDEKLEKHKERYRELFNEAHRKFRLLEDLGLEDISRAYQIAETDFYVDDINSMQEMFREVARAQVFIADPTSEPSVAKQVLESSGINIYVGRGNGDDDMKNFWKAVNMAKEEPEISGALAEKQYSGAFEYLYKVWQETPDPEKIYKALYGYVKKYYDFDWHKFSETEGFDKEKWDKAYHDYWGIHRGADMGANKGNYDFGDDYFGDGVDF